MWGRLIRFLAGSFDRVLASFPEECELYSRFSGRVRYVGHYLCELLERPTPTDRTAVRRRLGIATTGPVITLMPGSRRAEIESFTPCLLDAARQLQRRREEMVFLLPLADGSLKTLLQREVAKVGHSPPVRLLEGSHDALRASDLALIASGTATLEAALLGTPMVVFYRVSSSTYQGARILRRIGLLYSSRFALPNVVLQKDVVPELLQDDSSCANLVGAASELLADPARRDSMQAAFEDLRQILSRPDCLDTIASSIREAALHRGSGPEGE